MNIGRHAPNLRIGLCGAAGSGKTMFLGMLYFHVQQLAGFSIRPWDSSTARFASDFFRDSILQNGLPRPSRDPESMLHSYGIRRENRWRGGSGRLGKAYDCLTARFTFLDPARPPCVQQEASRASCRAWQAGGAMGLEWLRRSHGIVWLFDTGFAMGLASPVPRASSRDEVYLSYRSLLSELRIGSERSVHQAVAFCMAKVDLPGAWEYRNRPCELANQYLPRQLVDWINTLCAPARHKWFSVSSTGIAMDGGGFPIEGVDEKTNRLRASGGEVQPYGLYQPVGWLAATITGDEGWLL